MKDNIGKDMDDFLLMLEEETEKREKKQEKSYRKK